MREIKLRGWDFKRKQWVTPNNGIEMGWRNGTEKHTVFYPTPEYPDDDIEVSQSTGSVDKNGKDVYEGDIIKSRYTDYLYVICFEGRYVGNAISAPQTHISDISKITYNYYDVVGNIYENPGLLQKDA